ncbi:MAG: Prepilin peptidase CpaA [Candidatus Eremiobacteraeota bacterium]|jgi:prepilin peptidase CpaA|nr:Prepilin peptidase CpaA [Candidatus Eremiobacteraeota bacterium]
MTAPAIVLILVTCTAAAFDLRTRRIPNALTGAAALAALAVHVPAGAPAVFLSFAAMIAALLVGSIPFSAGWFGGGDVKLIAACCGLAGFPGAFSLILYVLIAGAVLAVVSAAARGRFIALVRSSAAVAAHGAPVQAATLPYAVAIAGGGIAYVVSTTIPVLRLPL